MSAKEAGQAFLEQLLAHVPADKQAAAREAFAESEALNELGAATLRQSDYSRNQDAINAYKGQLDEWFAQNKAALDEAARIKAGGVVPPAVPARDPIQSPAAVGLTREDLLTELASREQAAIAAIVHTSQLTAKHMKTFNEVLDIPKLMTDPDISKVGLLGVYDKHYKPKYDELALAAENTRIEAEVQKRLTEQRKQFTQMPYPVNGSEPSSLDAIEKLLANPPDPTKPLTPGVGSVDVVSSAVDQYNAAMARQMGQPTI